MLILVWLKVFPSNFVSEIRKSLTAISKLKGCEVLGEWIKPCERHLYWSATSTFNGNGRVIWAKFKSFLSHVVNKHSGFDDPLFNKCVHRDIQPRKWLKTGMGTLFWYYFWFGRLCLQCLILIFSMWNMPNINLFTMGCTLCCPRNLGLR